MLENKMVAVVVPCYNEENQVIGVIQSMPTFVDLIIIVDDLSKDRTNQIVKTYIDNDKSMFPKIEKETWTESDHTYDKATNVYYQIRKQEESLYTPHEIHTNHSSKVILISHLKNGGVGAAIASGYKYARDYKIDCTAVMAGDGQMDPRELHSICTPVINENIDYVKGNRLVHKSANILIPKTRFIGNSILSIFTKLASGYWHVSDTQTGYTAIGLEALNSIQIHKIYKRYGMPNDMLVKLNMAFSTLKEVTIKPVYDVGEQSKMKIYKVIPTVSWLLIKLFFVRLWNKYFFRDFHPLFLFYHMAFILFAFSTYYFIKIVRVWMTDGRDINELTILAFMFLFISGFQSLFFAMWMDMQDNERLYKS